MSLAYKPSPVGCNLCLRLAKDYPAVAEYEDKKGLVAVCGLCLMNKLVEQVTKNWKTKFTQRPVKDASRPSIQFRIKVG